MNKKIDEISMLKGAGILMVIFAHMASISGIPVCGTIRSLQVPVMAMFFFISGYTATVKGSAAIMVCYLIKKVRPVRNVLVWFGDNSMDHLMIHFFAAFLVAYTGGFWYNYLSEPVPAYDMRLNALHFVILGGHQSESQSLPPESQELSS